jgi:hypothetical protein
VNRPDDLETVSSRSHSPSHTPALRRITTFFGRKRDVDKDKDRASIISQRPSSNFFSTSPPRVQGPFGQVNGHDWGVMDRSASTHSYATVPSISSSTPQTVYPKSSPNQADISPSQWGSFDKLRGERSPTYMSSRSRPSTGNSNSLRHLPSPNMYDIPDDGDVDIPVQLGRPTNHAHPNLMPGQSLASAGTYRPSTGMDLTPRDILFNSSPRNTSPDHSNSFSGQNPSPGKTFIPTATSPSTKMLPSKSTSSTAELPPLGLEFLSSSPPGMPGGFPTIQTSPQRSSTTGSSQPNSEHVVAIQNATDNPLRIFHAMSGNVLSGTLEGLVQFLIDGFGKWMSPLVSFGS